MDNLFSGPGLLMLICGGALLLFAVLAVMGFMRNRTNRTNQPRYPANRQDIPTTGGVFNQPGNAQGRNLPGRARPLPGREGSGSARPTHDDPDVKSGGGFGKSDPDQRSDRDREGGSGFGG